MLFNQFSSAPYIPYNVIKALMSNEDIWKILKYPSYDCLSKPNLTLEEKNAMIWKKDVSMEKYRVFLTDLDSNVMPEGVTFLKLYLLDEMPTNHILSVDSYEFDVLYGSKIALIDYNGIPCQRGTVMQMLIMQSLNGQDVEGVGRFQYNSQLSRMCRGRANLGTSKNFTGWSFIMATQQGNVAL